MRHVAVVGAGVVGLACASVLQGRGHAISLIDPGPPGEGCSLGNAGCLSRASCVPLGLPGIWKKVPGWLLDRQGPLSIPLAYLPRVVPWLWRFHRATAPARVREISAALHALLTSAIEKWRPLAARAQVPELIVQEGYAFAYDSAAAFADDALGRALRRDHGVVLEVLEGAAIRAFDSALSPRLTHLVVFPEQGHCPNPLRLSRALAERLRVDGARFIAAAARDFEFADGQVARIVTDRDSIEVTDVVVAAGAHSRRLALTLGSDVPLETERGYHVMLEAPSIMPRIPVMSAVGKYFATPMEGGLRVAGTVELAGLDAPPSWSRADPLLEGARRLLPGLAHGAVTRWMGHRPSLPDSLPVIGRAPRHANAFFAFGHGHVGLTAAAHTGELIADLIDGREPRVPIAPFAADRFSCDVLR